MARAKEQVPAEPFVRWLNERLAFWATRCNGDVNGAAQLLAKEIGWDKMGSDGGVRNLYRYRKQMRGSSGGGRKFDVPTETFGRPAVEEALHCAGVRLGELYPYEALVDEFQMEYDVQRDQARVLADAWIERMWQTAWRDVGRFTLPEHRPRRYCAPCKRTTRAFAGCCEECMAPDKLRLLAAVA